MKDLVEINKYISARGTKEQLVLCTLVRKRGSSYRGVGAKKLVSLNSSESIGLLSGGCLEGSIEKFARENYAELPRVEAFSTLAEEDRLLGYQTGCRGVIEILFERVADYADTSLLLPFGPNPQARGVRVTVSGAELGKREFEESVAPAADLRTFFEPWREPVRLVLVGLGADADPYVPLARALGWELTLLDYRSSFVPEGRFPGERPACVPIAELGAHVPEGEKVAVVLMTHNYEADLEVLRRIRARRLGYLGCLGPATRFVNLQADLAKIHGESLDPQLLRAAHAPAGIFPKNDSPEAIALSVVAQIESLLEEKAGRGGAWSLVLAAGSAHRFGGPKALALWQGETLLARALRTAHAYSGERHLVVTGGHAEAISPLLGGARELFNAGWREGMGSSIARGIARILELDPGAESIAILPVDQPLVSAAHLGALAREASSANRVALTSEGRDYGPPAVIPKRMFPLAARLAGERGLKSFLAAADIVCVEAPDAFLDVDRPMDLARADAKLGPSAATVNS